LRFSIVGPEFLGGLRASSSRLAAVNIPFASCLRSRRLKALNWRLNQNLPFRGTRITSGNRGGPTPDHYSITPRSWDKALG